MFLVGYWKTCRLDKAFNQADNQKRESSGVTGALESLSNINRDDYDGWKYYLQVYYTNFDVLHSWATLGFYRRWRRTREINGEQLKARFKNTVLRPNSIMPQPTPLIISALQQQQQAQATAPPLPSSIMPQPTPLIISALQQQQQEQPTAPPLPSPMVALPAPIPQQLREEVQRRPEQNIVAWGAGKFGKRPGMAPMPNEALKKYVARFARVILIPEYNTSQTCLCGRKTEPYKVSMKTCTIMLQPILRFSLQVFERKKCHHIQRMVYEQRKPNKNWKTRRRYCLQKMDGRRRNTILHPYMNCSYNIYRANTEVVRHRVCTHCCADYHNGRLVGDWVDLESWRLYLQDVIAARHYDSAAIWNKDHMAAMNMRLILEHWGETMRRPEWNLPPKQRRVPSRAHSPQGDTH
jgi:hypothetical protein